MKANKTHLIFFLGTLCTLLIMIYENSLAQSPLPGSFLPLGTSRAPWLVTGALDVITFDSCHNVGIGTTAPSERLEIFHSDPTGGIAIEQRDSSYSTNQIKFSKLGHQEWAIGNSVDTVGSHDRPYFFIWSEINQTMSLFIDGENGMTGIGTSWPRARLEVAGNMRVDALGINTDPPTTNDSSKLWVEGGIAAREVRVTVNNFPDFCFEESYNLMLLEDLKSYVAINKHLPGIPSKDEVEKSEGIELGAFQTKLLQKIEEQALYIIGLNDQLNSLKEEVDHLKRQLKED